MDFPSLYWCFMIEKNYFTKIKINNKQISIHYKLYFNSHSNKMSYSLNLRYLDVFGKKMVYTMDKMIFMYKNKYYGKLRPIN